MPPVNSYRSAETLRECSTVDEVYESLLTRLGEFAPQPRLMPTARALELLGDPHRSFPIIHITGTNGKTSTSRMIEEILRARGNMVGLITSPHLVSFTERIVINGRPVSDDGLLRAWESVRVCLEAVDAELLEQGDLALTFFEALTVLAFTVLADAEIDVGVVEVGVGGAWDSTNVADGRVAVITPISLDHMQQLGSTVGEIARTKAGIIKRASTVVIAAQPAEALVEIARVCQAADAQLLVEGEHFTVLDRRATGSTQLISIRTPSHAEFYDLGLTLAGAHQAQNAAVAIAAVEAFFGGGEWLAETTVREALSSVRSPGRLELLSESPPLIVDAAHNPGGAESLVAGLDDFAQLNELWFVLGVLKGKDAAGIVSILRRRASVFATVQSHSARAVTHDDLIDVVVAASPFTRNLDFDSLTNALRSAREWATEAPGRGVVVCGSITLLHEAATAASAIGWGALPSS